MSLKIFLIYKFFKIAKYPIVILGSEVREFRKGKQVMAIIMFTILVKKLPLN